MISCITVHNVFTNFYKPISLLEKYAISGTTSALEVVNIVIPPAVEHTITVTVATKQAVVRSPGQ